MDGINWDDLDLEDLLNTPILDLDDNEFISNTIFQSPNIPSCSNNVESNFSNALSHSSKIPSCSGGIDYNYEENFFMSNFSHHYPSLDMLMEKQQTFETDVEEFLKYSEEITPQDLSMEKQNQLEKVMPIATTIDVIVGNGDQYNEYTSNSIDHLSEVSMALPLHPQQEPKVTIINAIIENGDHQSKEYHSNSMAHLSKVSMELPPHPQESLKESTYNGKEKFLPVNGYPNMDVSKDGLYQGRMDISTCNRGQEQGFFSCDNVSMSMSMPLLGMDYQNMTMRSYNLSNSFQQHDYGSTNIQVLGDKHLQQQQQQQQQQHNNSLTYGCSNSTPLTSDISNPNESILKIGHISFEEKKEKINRFLQKRKERNFNKKIKYECRKTLANRRPRVRGRFAKNEDLGEMIRVNPNNH